MPFVTAVVPAEVFTDWLAHAPSVSPCRRCAGTAAAATEIVWNGFFFEWVRWQTSTLYWYCADDGLPSATVAMTARDVNMAAARPSAAAARSMLFLIPAPFPSPSLGGLTLPQTGRHSNPNPAPPIE